VLLILKAFDKAAFNKLALSVFESISAPNSRKFGSNSYNELLASTAELASETIKLFLF